MEINGGVRARQQDEVELAAALHGALDEDAPGLAYRTLVRCGDGGTVGLEAELRWEMPGSGTIPPEVYVPIAERYGLMIKLGRWVLRTACSQLAAWERAGLARELLVHVDLSAPELMDPDLVAVVCETLGESGVAPDRLCLQVSEASIRASGTTAERTLHALDDVGVRLALDDFRTGSTIEALTRFQFDYAKVSRGLIAGMESPMQRKRLIGGLLGMAKALGTTLVAEGAEHDDEIDRIASLGLVRIQGGAAAA